MPRMLIHAVPCLTNAGAQQNTCTAAPLKEPLHNTHGVLESSWLPLAVCIVFPKPTFLCISRLSLLAGPPGQVSAFL